MTQRTIRYVCLVYSIAVAIVLGIGALFYEDQSNATLLIAYEREMLRRVGYVTSFLEWIPAGVINTDAFLAATAVELPFTVSMVPSASSSIRTLTIGHSFPYIASEYSEVLDSVVSIVEHFASHPVFGCPRQLVATGAVFIFMSILSLLLLVMMANTLAYTKPEWVWSVRGLLALGLVMPIVLGVVEVAVLVHIQGQCTTQVYAENLMRSVGLYSWIFEQESNLYSAAIHLPLLVATLDVMNENFVGTDYAVHLLNYSTGNTVVPPLGRGYDVNATLVSADGGKVVFSIPDLSPRHILQSVAMAQQDVVMIGILDSGDAYSSIGRGAGLTALLLVLIPSVVIAAVAFAAFPWGSIGKLTGEEDWRSPWEWRTSRQWPLTQLFMAAMLVAFTLGMVCSIVERLSVFYNISALFVQFLQATMKIFFELSQFGSALLSNYASLMSGGTWNTNAMANLTSAQLTMVHRFYQSVFTALMRCQYYQESAAAQATDEYDPGTLPTLSINAAIQEFFISNLQQESLTPVISLCYAWDVELIYALLSADTSTLQTGNTTIQALLLTAAAVVDPANGEATINRAIKSTLTQMSPFASTANSFADQTGTFAEVNALYSTPTGLEVVELENAAISALTAVQTGSQKVDAVYVFSEVRVVATSIVVIAMFAIYSIGSFSYTAYFFGRSNGSWDSHNPRRLPSNDYTAPTNHLNVNHGRLWWNVRLASIAMVALAAVCIFNIGWSAAESRKSVNTLTSGNSFFAGEQNWLLADAESVGGISISAAAWLRAFVAMTKDTLRMAVQSTYAWCQYEEVEWNGNKPSSYNTANTSEVDDLRSSLLHTSALVSALINGNTGTVYNDFLQVMSYHRTAIDIASLYACMTATQFNTLMDTLDQYWMGLLFGYPSSAFAAYYSKISAMTGTCADWDEILIFLKRGEVLKQRTKFFWRRAPTASTLEGAASAASSEEQAVLDASVSQQSALSMQKTPLTYVPMVMVWLCVPILCVMYWASRNIFASIYFS